MPFHFLLVADWIYALLMGVVQGLTEFLPVSSSGHLSLLNLFFGIDAEAGLDFTFFLHVATLVAALIYFRKDIAGLVCAWLPKNEEAMAGQRRISVFLLVSCLITGPMALLLEDHLAFIASSFLLLGFAFLATALLLTLTEILVLRMTHKCDMDDMGFARAALIGFVQGCAVIPGISRSGATIVGGMWAGLSRENATRYSFLLAIPIIMAGVAKDGYDLLKGGVSALPPFAISALGFIAAGISGYFAIAGMIKLVQRTSLVYFALYVALLGLILIAVSFIV